jgi:hypothetical protein
MATGDPPPPGTLHPAFRSYQTLDPAAPEGDTLNLAWTRDERDGLSVDLAAVLASELRAELDDEPRYLDRYLVRDPYGEETLGPAVAAAFALPAWQGRVTCGAGVVSLLHGLAWLPGSGGIHIIGDIYPDFPYWVTQSGGTSAPPHSAALWFLERPSLIGDAFAELADLGALCEEAARHGALVLVDESNANYYPPAWSAVGLALAQPNLVVARGFSKTYGLGGLRLACCVASPPLTQRVRSLVPPLLASSLSLRLGKRVLSLGDIAAPLRTRVHAHKREVTQLLERAGVGELVPSSQHLPYIFSRASAEHLRARLEARGVLGKHHPIWSGPSAALGHIYRLSIPVSEARMARLRQLLS